MQTRKEIQKFIVLIIVQGMYLAPFVNMDESRNIQIYSLLIYWISDCHRKLTMRLYLGPINLFSH